MHNPKGKIMEPVFYDNAYSLKDGSTYDYNKHYSEMTVYLDLWKKALSYLKEIDDPSILEVGCGTGQFAELLYDAGYKKYVGIDFSRTGIERARKRCSYAFYLEDARHPFHIGYNTVIALEVFEHTDDMMIISNLTAGSNIVFSVPMSDYCAHIRYFLSVEEVIDRYKDVIELEKVEKFGLYFIGKGKKK